MTQRESVPMFKASGLRGLDWLARFAVIGWVCYAALGANLFNKRAAWPDTMVDYHIIYDASRQIVEHRSYPPSHPYPPAAVVLHYGLAQLSFPTSALVWLMLTSGSALACLGILARLLGFQRWRGSLILGFLAFAAASPFFVWDLRMQNCNLVFLLALLIGVYCLARQHPAAAGFWLVLSFSLKLFSILTIPYLLWRREWRAFGWTLAFIAVFWLLLPGLVFGPEGTVEIYQAWLAPLRRAAHDHVDLNHPVLISLRNSAHRLAQGNPLCEELLVAVGRGAWLAIGLVGLMASRRRRDDRRDPFGLLADISLLTLAPIAVSSYLEPYHAVPIAIPAALLAQAACDPRQRARLRVAALLLLIGVALLPVAYPAWEIRGLVVNLTLMLAVLGAITIGWLRSTEDSTSALPLGFEAPSIAARAA